MRTNPVSSMHLTTCVVMEQRKLRDLSRRRVVLLPKAQAPPQTADTGLESISSSVGRREKIVMGRLDFHRGILKTIELGTASSFFLRPPILALNLVSFSKARAPKMRSMEVPR